MASGAPIVDTKSKEYRREAMFLVLNILRAFSFYLFAFYFIIIEHQVHPLCIAGTKRSKRWGAIFYFD